MTLASEDQANVGGFSGHDATSYINTAGTDGVIDATAYGTPTWGKLGRIADVNLNDERNTSETKHRDSDYIKIIPGRRKKSYAGTYERKRATDSIYTALKRSYENNQILDFVEMDREITYSGAVGTRQPMQVTKWNEKQGDEESVKVEFELMLRDTQIPGTTNDWEPTPMATT